MALDKFRIILLLYLYFLVPLTLRRITMCM